MSWKPSVVSQVKTETWNSSVRCMLRARDAHTKLQCLRHTVLYASTGYRPRVFLGPLTTRDQQLSWLSHLATAKVTGPGTGGQRCAPAGFERSAKQRGACGRASDVEDDAHELGTSRESASLSPGPKVKLPAWFPKHKSAPVSQSGTNPPLPYLVAKVLLSTL